MLSLVVLGMGAVVYERMSELHEAVQILQQQNCDYYVVELATNGTKYVMGPYQTEYMAMIVMDAEVSYGESDSIYVSVDCNQLECECAK